MKARTGFQLAMLDNGYWPLLNNCKRAKGDGWQRQRPSRDEVLSWDRSALTSTGMKIDGDLAVIDVDVADASLVAKLADASCSRAASCATPVVPRKPGSRASMNRSGTLTRGTGIAGAISATQRR
jgi:hypothetical protein